MTVKLSSVLDENDFHNLPCELIWNLLRLDNKLISGYIASARPLQFFHKISESHRFARILDEAVRNYCCLQCETKSYWQPIRFSIMYERERSFWKKTIKLLRSCIIFRVSLWNWKTNERIHQRNILFYWLKIKVILSDCTAYAKKILRENVYESNDQPSI